jgi:hypothetical protein
MELVVLLALLVAVILIPAVQQYRKEIELQRVLMRLDDRELRRRLPK